MAHEILRTERMTLRQMTMADADDLLTIFSDPEAMRFYPSTKDRAEAIGWIQWNLGMYERHGHGLWLATLNETGEFVGQCGLVTQHVDGKDEIEVGYLFVRRLWGQGLATEAARACSKYAADTFGYRRLISLIHPDNKASRRVAEKMGMQLEQTAHWHDNPTCVYAMETARTA